MGRGKIQGGIVRGEKSGGECPEGRNVHLPSIQTVLEGENLKPLVSVE